MSDPNMSNPTAAQATEAVASAMQKLETVAAAIGEVSSADHDRLAELRTQILGRKAGLLTEILRSLGTLPAEERRPVGARANELKRELEAAIADRELALESAADKATGVDWSMPGRARWRGAINPVTAVVDEICEIFRELGFTRVVGPEAETEEYNFTKLNTPLNTQRQTCRTLST